MVVRAGEIGGGEDRDHAGRGFRVRRIDALDIGEAVRRAHEIRGERAVRLHVIAKAALPAQQRVVLDTAGPCGIAGFARACCVHEKLHLEKT